MTAPIERYVRATLEAGGVEMILGIEFRDGDDFGLLREAAKEIMRDAYTDADADGRVTPTLLASHIEADIKDRWPDRYWFVEVCAGGDRDGWVQVFAPPDRPALPRGAHEVVTMSAEEFEAALIGDDAMWSPTPYGKGHDE